MNVSMGLEQHEQWQQEIHHIQPCTAKKQLLDNRQVLNTLIYKSHIDRLTFTHRVKHSLSSMHVYASTQSDRQTDRQTGTE